jgi:hypothetical protein
MPMRKDREQGRAEPVPRIAARYDSRKEWKPDPKGYFLIKIFPKKQEIGLRHMSYDRKPLLDIFGKDAETIAQTAVREGLVTTLPHAAYLGYELQRAETALKLRKEYIQDKPVEFATRETRSRSAVSRR